MGILSVVAILGVLATIVVISLPGSSPPSATTLPGQTTTTIPRTPGQGVSAAAVAACKADFATLSSAVSTYRALNGAAPPAGTAWASASANGGPFMSVWPSEPGQFRLTWDGATLSVVPAHGPASHGSFGTSTPATGCFRA